MAEFTVNKVRRISEFRMIQGFSESVYLEANPDVSEALKQRSIESVNGHLFSTGLNEIKTGRRRFHKDLEPFSEKLYLETFPDIKDAVEKGAFKSGFDHFCRDGYVEILHRKRLWRKHDLRKISFLDLDDTELHEYHIMNSYTLDWSRYMQANVYTFVSDDPIVDYIKNWSYYFPVLPGVFDTAFYLNTYADVKRSGINPLVHFLTDGNKEGRLPCNA